MTGSVEPSPEMWSLGRRGASSETDLEMVGFYLGNNGPQAAAKTGGEMRRSEPPGRKETRAVRLMRIQGKADRVFEAIRNICLKHPAMTLAQAGQMGLLGARLQNTVPYEIGKYPEVTLEIGIEDN